MNNADAVVVDLSSRLSLDYEKLYESEKYTDILVHVGREPNDKIFVAHTVVLCTRSTYLEGRITEHSVESNNVQRPTIVLEDVTPNVFEILLRFIYTGKVLCKSCEGINWLDLLKEANKFGLKDLIDEIGRYLILQQDEWLQKNILKVYEFALKMEPPALENLKNHCFQLMILFPKLFFECDDIGSKGILIELLKSDDLNMDEGDIWMSVVRWAVRQVPGLANDPNNWSSNQVDDIKDIIGDCIKYMRFFNFSSKDFSETVIPYVELLPRELRSDVFKYYVLQDYKPTARMSPLRKSQLPSIDSEILNKQQAAWISRKIMESTKRQGRQRAPIDRRDFYKLTLLYRQSRDGNELSKFIEKCRNKGPTITVGKVAGTKEILGGYNPIVWTFPSATKWVASTESFIFSIDKEDLEKSIVSSVTTSNGAIQENDTSFPHFGHQDLFFGPAAIAKKYYYEVPIRSSSDKFTWDNWEMFLVSKF